MLAGNVGTTGDEAVVAVPLAAIGAANGGRIVGFQAFTELGSGHAVIDTAGLTG